MLYYIIFYYIILSYIYNILTELYIYIYIHVHTYMYIYVCKYTYLYYMCISYKTHSLVCLIRTCPVAQFLHIFPVILDRGVTMGVSCRKQLGIQSNLDIWWLGFDLRYPHSSNFWVKLRWVSFLFLRAQCTKYHHCRFASAKYAGYCWGWP